jgi:hypothetical protein
MTAALDAALASLTDLDMMVMLTGRERTLAEYCGLQGCGPPLLQEHSDPLANGGY